MRTTPSAVWILHPGIVGRVGRQRTRRRRASQIFTERQAVESRRPAELLEPTVAAEAMTLLDAWAEIDPQAPAGLLEGRHEQIVLRRQEVVLGDPTDVLDEEAGDHVRLGFAL